MKQITRSASLSSASFLRLRLWCALGAGLLGAAPLLGWLVGAREWTRMVSTSIPMAPNTALAFVVLATALALVDRRPRADGVKAVRRGPTRCAAVAAALVGLLVSLRLCEFLPGVDWSTDRWFLAFPAETFQQAPVGKMAYQTASTLLLASLALLLLTLTSPQPGIETAAGSLSGTVTALGLIFFLGYLYGTPFLSHRASIPMALNTSLACVFLGVGLLVACGPEAFPLRSLSGPSVHARLLRAFLPFTAFTVCVVAWLMHFISLYADAESAALVSAILVVAALVPVGWISAHLARSAGTDLERVEDELRTAERQSRNYATELQALNVTLEQRVTERTQQLQQLADDLAATALSEAQAHEALKKAQAQLVQTEKLAALGQLVAGVAHEINNPLSFVSNNVAVLQRDVGAVRNLLALYAEAEALLAKETPNLAERIREESERIDLRYTLGNLDGLLNRSRDGLKRIQQIVKDLRDFARLDESDLHDVDLNAGITSTLNIIQGQARKQQVALELDLKPLPLVSCYPAKINQVVLNLVTNALDACSAGGKVTVGSRATPEGVEIFVADTGCGIEPAIREKIFDPFFTTKPQGKGTGLGLSISYGIVQAHGGTITVESTVGQGTRFVVRLKKRMKDEG